MNLIIGSKAIKIFIKALKFLAKFNPEYIIIAKDNKLHIKAVCKNQVSLATTTFNHFFFVKYEESQNEEENMCRVSAKILLGVLRHSTKIASCTFRLDVPNDCIYIDVHKNNDFVVMNKVSLLEFDEIDDFVIPAVQSEVICQPSLFRRVLQTSKLDELKFDFQNDMVTVQSYIDYPEEDCEAIRLHYTIDTLEFSTYDLKEEKSVIASCDDFIIFLNLAQSLNTEIVINFSNPGFPMSTKLSNDGHYSMTLIQATLPPKSFSKRNIKNHSYKEVVMNYVEKRKAYNESRQKHDKTTSSTTIPKFTESGLQSAINPSIAFTDPRPKQSSHQNNPTVLGAKNKSKESNLSSPPSYISTPSSIEQARGISNKRKSSDEVMETQVELDETLDGLLSKRRRVQQLDSTILNTNQSVNLTQMEICEVNDIMANIDDYCGMDDDDDDIIIPHAQPRPVLPEYSQNIVDDIEMKDAQDTENTDKTNINDNLFSEGRWSLHNSYFNSNTENTEKEKLPEKPKQQPKKPNPIEEIFGHIFKPRSKARFGKVLVPASDSEDD